MRYCSGSNQDNSNCTNKATKKVSCFWVCDIHGAFNYNYIRNNSLGRIIYHSVENGNLRRHSFGITYFVELPNGNIKIGFSMNEENLKKRMRSLCLEFNGRVKILATLWGGETLEAYYHYKFRNNRLFSHYLEQFNPNGIKEEIESLGNIPPGMAAKYIIENGNYVESSTEARRVNVRKVSCPKCKALAGEKCIELNGGFQREVNHSERTKIYSANRRLL